MSEKLQKNTICDISITSESSDGVLEYIITRLYKRDEKVMIVTPNPEIMIFAHHQPSFKNTLNQAQIAIPDGVGLMWAARFLNHPLKERITGIDFMENVCEKLSKQTVTVGFLGGRGKVAELTAECLREKYPGLHISYIAEEWDEADCKAQLSKAGVDHVDMLFVAFGFPKQEVWIAEHLNKIPVTAAMGVGGAFDFISGKVGRAPKLVRQLGLEWLWRLIRQPWRARRQLALIEFVGLVIAEKFKNNTKNHPEITN